MIKSSVILFMMAMLILASCHKDSDSEESQTTTPPPIPTNVEEVQGNVVGYVYDLNGAPVEGATVSIYSGTTITNREGIFTFTSQNMDPSGTYIKVSKAGYILGSDYIYPVSSATTFSYVQMLPLVQGATVDASTGGRVDIIGGGTVTFRPNSIARADGSVYGGPVQVSAYRIASDDSNLGDRMPGGLYAVTAAGTNAVLATYGMVAVELRDPSGNELNLADDNTAEVVFPIADVQESVAPAEIELWSFDEVQGIWVEEGAAVRDGDNYIAEVSHFSFWNCDVPFPLVQMCGSVVYNDGEPVQGAQIMVQAGNAGVSFGWTDVNGNYCGKMPKGQELTISVVIPGCPDPVSVVTRGPYFSNGTIEEIVIDLDATSIEGTVLCDDIPQGGAQVIIRRGNSTFVRTTSTDGSFSYLLGEDPCASGSAFDVFALLPSGQASETVTVSSGNDNIELEACNGGCPISISITNTPDPCEPFVGQLSASVTGGSGSYDLQWENSGTTDSVSFYEIPGLYCVSVIDVMEQCTVRQCIEIEQDSLQMGLLTVSTNTMNAPNCNGGGSIELIIAGGAPPYSITWSSNGVDLVQYEDQTIANDLGPAIYDITVTDSNGCLVEARAPIGILGGIDIAVEVEQDCETSIVTAEASGGTAPYTYIFDYANQIQNGQGNVFNLIKQPGLPSFVFITVIDANGCESSTEAFVGSFVAEPNVEGNLECFENGFYRQVLLDTLFNVVALDEDDQVVFEGFDSFWTFEMSPTTFDLTLSLGTPDGFCTFTAEVMFPRFFGLDVTSASNGTITADIDPTAQCRDCQQVDAFEIYTENLFDVTSSNGGLQQGTYYVVVRDINTNCVIAIEEVILN